MEAYEKEQFENEVLPDSRAYGLYSNVKNWLGTLLGVLIMFFGIALVFVVASLEGTKEIKASNVESGKILTIWRDSHGTEIGFPEEKTDIIVYNEHEYYFVVDKLSEQGEILSWHFSYDGGFEYIFSDVKYYVLTGLTLLISSYVSLVNYKSAKAKAKQRKQFVSSLSYYKKNKDLVKDFVQYIPDFCDYKNKQTYLSKEREIVENAGITYSLYKEGKVKLEKWQQNKLKALERIKVKRMKTSDLLQENENFSRKVEMLPSGEAKLEYIFLAKGVLSKLVTTALSGLVIGFGIVLGNWVLGATYGFTIFMSYVSSVISGTDATNSTLRNRYIAKGDYLQEFYNIREMFIKKPKEEAKIEAKTYVVEAAEKQLPVAYKTEVYGDIVFQSGEASSNE
jgi:hypothetical protein